jgi:hypothetical protein
MQQFELHVLPQKDRWQVSGDDAFVALYDTKEDALRQACDRAQAMCDIRGKTHWTMVLHDSDGQVYSVTVPC